MGHFLFPQIQWFWLILSQEPVTLSSSQQPIGQFWWLTPLSTSQSLENQGAAPRYTIETPMTIQKEVTPDIVLSIQDSRAYPFSFLLYQWWFVLVSFLWQRLIVRCFGCVNVCSSRMKLKKFSIRMNGKMLQKKLNIYKSIIDRKAPQNWCHWGAI